jgi:3-deoxy-D-manno-octulosonate 8-phosphate phosphatase KdsC-like HAD superfamily phosphatase
MDRPYSCPLKCNQHVEIARALLTKRDERLIFNRIVPRIERVHVGKFDHDNSLWFSVSALRKSVRVAFCEVPTAMLGDHRSDLGSVLLELSRIGDDVFDDKVCLRHGQPSI